MALYVKTGTYTGTGSGSITTNLTFTPKAVIIWGPAQATATSFFPRIKTDTMNANDSGVIGGNTTYYTDGNLTFSGNSFVSAGTGTNGMNINTKVYHWLALGGVGCVTGTYTGDATDARSITGLGIDPDLVIIKRAAGGVAQCKTTSTGKTTDAAFVFNLNGVNPNTIQKLITDGFEIGTNLAVNALSAVYHYLALQKSGNTGCFNEGTYTGDGVDNRSITGVGFNPSFVLTRGNGTGSIPSTVRTVETTDTSASWGYADTGANRIQQFVTDGFEIGTALHVNENTYPYYWFAFKDNEPQTTNTGNFFSFM